MLWMRTQMISNVPYFIILEDIQHISALSTWPRGPHRFSAPMGEQTFARTSHISDLRVMPPSLPWKKYQFIDSCPINNIKTSIFTEDFHDKLIQITYESRWSTYIISWKIAIIFHGGIHGCFSYPEQLHVMLRLSSRQMEGWQRVSLGDIIVCRQRAQPNFWRISGQKLWMTHPNIIKYP